MSVANVLTEIARATEQYTVAVKGTYTVNVGADHHRVAAIKVTSPAAAFTITVPDGLFMGQELQVYLVTALSTNYVTVSYNATTAVLTATGDYIYLKWMGADWLLLGDVTTE